MCAKRESDPWEMKNLENAMKSLKKDKARDPNGWINDLFKDGVAGTNLKISMLKSGYLSYKSCTVTPSIPLIPFVPYVISLHMEGSKHDEYFLY